jgi:hypothetical protein
VAAQALITINQLEDLVEDLVAMVALVVLALAPVVLALVLTPSTPTRPLLSSAAACLLYSWQLSQRFSCKTISYVMLNSFPSKAEGNRGGIDATHSSPILECKFEYNHVY